MAFITINHHAPADNGAAFVAENATLAGSVRLEKNSSVWYGAVLRADTGRIAIGENSNVQDNAVLHGGQRLPDWDARDDFERRGHRGRLPDRRGGACAGEHAGARGEPCHRRARQGRAARQRGTGCRHQGQ